VYTYKILPELTVEDNESTIDVKVTRENIMDVELILKLNLKKI